MLILYTFIVHTSLS